MWISQNWNVQMNWYVCYPVQTFIHCGPCSSYYVWMNEKFMSCACYFPQNLDGACIQSVNLVIDEDPRTEITMSHSGEVFLASQFRISLPYSDGKFQCPLCHTVVIFAVFTWFSLSSASIRQCPLLLCADVFQIQELSSMFVQVKSSQGLRLQYNWREFRLYLQLEEQWRDDTVGLCGTFNGNIQDDFLLVLLYNPCFLYHSFLYFSSYVLCLHIQPQKNNDKENIPNSHF